VRDTRAVAAELEEKAATTEPHPVGMGGPAPARLRPRRQSRWESSSGPPDPKPRNGRALWWVPLSVGFQAQSGGLCQGQSGGRPVGWTGGGCGGLGFCKRDSNGVRRDTLCHRRGRARAIGPVPR